jgi:predicted ATPase
MTIRRIKAKNFKCFEDLDIKLDDFNILIGANATGKTNFVQVLRFLRDIIYHDLDNAISLQGGGEYIRNIKILGKMPMTIGIEFFYTDRTALKWGNELIGLESVSVDYNFSLDFEESEHEYKIVHDELNYYIDIHKVPLEDSEVKDGTQISSGKIQIQAFHDEPLEQDQNNCKVQVEFVPNTEIPEDISNEISKFFSRHFLDEIGIRELLLDSPYAVFPFDIFRFFRGIRIYDFEPKGPKEIVSVSGKVTLDENGDNLAIVLARLKKGNEEWSSYINVIRDILPFISDLDISKLGDKAMFIQLREGYSEKDLLPASMVSDGTVSIIALVYAIYFESGSVAIIEEPERNLHPGLISKLVDMMQDASRGKQIIITTHNLEVIRNADMESILLMSRDDEGYTHISRPYEYENVRVFLKNDLGIADLYLDNLLVE